MDKTALDLLDAAYKRSQIVEDEGQPRRRFLGSDAANALGLSTAARPGPQAYHQAMALLEESGAVEKPAIRGQAIAEESFYDITPHGEAMLREARRIA